jgi:hypothetical protein
VLYSLGNVDFAQKMDKWKTLVHTAMKFQILQNPGIILSEWTILTCQRGRSSFELLTLSLRSECVSSSDVTSLCNGLKYLLLLSAISWVPYCLTSQTDQQTEMLLWMWRYLSLILYRLTFTCQNSPIYCRKLCCSTLKVERSSCETNCSEQFYHKICLFWVCNGKKPIADRQSQHNIYIRFIAGCVFRVLCKAIIRKLKVQKGR